MRKLILVSLFLLVSPDLSAEAEVKKTQAKVVAAHVEGKVDALDVETEVSRSVKTKDVMSEKNAVNVAASSAATVVFSNGATINIGESSSLVIAEFLQDPFSTPFAMPVETEEPSVSTMKLNLKEGEAVCKVKKLRTEEGSSMTINTPAGAAGIRGTTVAISYLPNAGGEGEGRFILSVTEGSVSLTDHNGEEEIVEAGQEIEITFTWKTDPETGKTIIIAILKREKRAIADDRVRMINQVAENGERHANTIIFEPLEWDVLDIGQIVEEVHTVINPPDPITEMNPPSNFDNDR